MKLSHMGRLVALTTTVIFMFTGCGSQVAPTGGAPQSSAIATHGKSWMLPEAKRRDLLYVSDDALSDVDVYSLGQV